MLSWLKHARQGDLPRRRAVARAADARPILFEQLESRLLLSAGVCPPMVESIDADNRGRIVLTFTESMNQASFIAGAFSIITAGVDRRFGTADDVSHQVTVEVLPDTDRKQVRVTADLLPGAQYQVLVRDTIRDITGLRLDGEFNGPGVPTGDGVEGGDLIFFTRTPASQIVRFTTVLGTIDVELFRDRTPISVANFLSYANSERYDETIIHRNVSTPTPFVIQGGGFTAARPFNPITVDAPIQNEPFLSNTRGTIAFAKLGGNPNSATSQWFFNLGDNSGNLDNQNGGFTVFGRITDDAGLAVMDAISALSNINAASLQGAFTDLPVLNDSPLPTANNVQRGDLVVIERVALLVDVSGEPAGMLEAPSFVFDSGLSARVFLYDLTGAGMMEDPTEMISVRFDGNRVRSITLKKGMSMSGMGIAISGATGVAEFKDARGAGAGDLAFIISDARIGRITLQSSVTGANINGMIVGDILLKDDLDEDGVLNDRTAIFVPEGFVDFITVKGALRGDVIVPGGVQRVKVLGDVNGVDMMIGAAPDPRMEMTFDFRRVADLSINSQTPIRTVKAQEWVDGDASVDRLRAPSIDIITITGARGGVAGDFYPTIVLTGSDNNTKTLHRLTVAGVLGNADFTSEGDVGLISAKGGINNWRASIAGDIDRIVAGSISGTNIDATGAIDLISVTEWIGGELQADSVRRIVTTGARRLGIDGDFVVDMNLRGAETDLFTLDTMVVKGAIRSSFWSVGDSIRMVNAKGGLENFEMQVQFHVVDFRAGAVHNAVFDVTGSVGRLFVQSWDGGRLNAVELQRFRANGLRRAGDDGDVHANFTVNRALDFFVAGDLFDSTILINQSDFDPRPALERMTIRGAIIDSLVRARGIIGTIDAVGMHGSTIVAGTSTTNEFFPTAASQVNVRGVIQNVNIRRVTGQDIAFTNSYIVASTIENAYISEIDVDNGHVPFGVAAREINSLTYRIDGLNTTYRTRDGAAPGPFGDFQIRVNFVAPPIPVMG